MYKVLIKKSALRELKNIQKTFRLKIINEIDELSLDLRPSGVRKLENFINSYRIRVGNYRIIYHINDSKLLIDIIKVADRKDAYKDK